MELQPLNSTFTFTLQIVKLDVPQEAVYSVFFAGCLIYIFAVFSNVTILVLIVTQQSLHKPMFYIFFSLPLADLIGITCAFPRLLVDIVAQTNVVYYPTCVLQAFLVHMYGGSILFNLAAMSFDRYIAICKPLRYNSIMNHYTVCGVISVAWGLNFVLVLVLFVLQAKIPKCKTLIVNVYCDNPSLLQLSCDGDLMVNNIYGLATAGLIQAISLAIQLFCYVQILMACIPVTQTEARLKALNTCLAQFISFIMYEIVCTTAILSYRFEYVSPNARKIVCMLIFTFPPVVNPILYGVKIRDVRKAFIVVLKKRKVMSS